jgi:hypothetical protein
LSNDDEETKGNERGFFVQKRTKMRDGEEPNKQASKNATESGQNGKVSHV